MSAWLISIVGIVSLGVLIEIVLPEGENSKYIRGIFSIIVVFVIVAPIPKLTKGDYFKDFVKGEEQIEIDEDYYESVKNTIRADITQRLKDKLESTGYGDITFYIEFDEDYVYAIEKVTVDGKFTDEEWTTLKRIIKEYVGKAAVERK